LGDIVICPAVAFRNAPEHAGTYDDELALLVVHGLLHLMGMDHDEDDEAEEMETKERELLARHHAALRPQAWPAKRAAEAEAGTGAETEAGAGAVPASEGAAAVDGDEPGGPGAADGDSSAGPR